MVVEVVVGKDVHAARMAIFVARTLYKVWPRVLLSKVMSSNPM